MRTYSNTNTRRGTAGCCGVVPRRNPALHFIHHARCVLTRLHPPLFFSPGSITLCCVGESKRRRRAMVVLLMRQRRVVRQQRQRGKRRGSTTPPGGLLFRRPGLLLLPSYRNRCSRPSFSEWRACPAEEYPRCWLPAPCAKVGSSSGRAVPHSRVLDISFVVGVATNIQKKKNEIP